MLLLISGFEIWISSECFQLVFLRQLVRFGKPDIDLFASSNFQVETFVSWKPEPTANLTNFISIIRLRPLFISGKIASIS